MSYYVLSDIVRTSTSLNGSSWEARSQDFRGGGGGGGEGGCVWALGGKDTNL